ncbi:MAG: acetyltransferase [Conexibacter sp.]|nr:acetyltransferase [Conexibacter sp.]
MVAALGASDAVRRPDAIGAKVDGAADNHWLDAAVVPYDATPPAADDPSLPHCVWTTAGAMAEREEVPVIAMPCLGVELAALDGADPGARDGQAPPMAVVGDLNDRAYGQFEALAPLLGGVAGDDRLRAHGVRVEGEWACVALTLRLGDDASVQYVATEERFRRRGLASRLLLAALAAERDAGATTATLQASPDGLGVYERLGFRRVALLKAFVRAP